LPCGIGAILTPGGTMPSGRMKGDQNPLTVAKMPRSLASNSYLGPARQIPEDRLGEFC
jgi:hypothetical protein